MKIDELPLHLAFTHNKFLLFYLKTNSKEIFLNMNLQTIYSTIFAGLLLFRECVMSRKSNCMKAKIIFGMFGTNSQVSKQGGHATEKI